MAKLEDVDSIFGTPITMVKTYAARYRFICSLCIILDIIIVIVACLALYVRGTPSELLEMCFVCAVAINMLIGFATKSEYREVFSFYLKNKSRHIDVKRYSVDESKLFSVLFCAGYKRVDSDCSFDTYKEMLNSACIQNKAYSKKIMKYLKQYESEEGVFQVVVCDNKYYVDFKEV